MTAARHDLGAYTRIINVNLIGTFNMMRIAAAAMAKTEPADEDGLHGVVVNTSSVAGIEGRPADRLFRVQGRHHRDDRARRAGPECRRGAGEHHLPRHHRHPHLRVGENAEEVKAKLVAPVVFPKRMGRPDEFGHLVRALIENDYMNAEVIRFDGGIRLQP